MRRTGYVLIAKKGKKTRIITSGNGKGFEVALGTKSEANYAKKAYSKLLKTPRYKGRGIKLMLRRM